MADRINIGAVSYLNTLPLVHGMANGLAADRVRLSYATPAVLADRLAAGELDVALLPVIELARIPELEIVPGLGITTDGPSRSVLLVSKQPVEQIGSVALDPDSRTSNVLCRLLLAEVWNNRPETLVGQRNLGDCLRSADAAVRIGDKALFEPVPPQTHVYDLSEVWTRETKLPFVFAAWTARAGVVDRELYRVLHASRREGSKAIGRIAEDYRWNGTPRPEVAREYLTEQIHFRLGAAELQAMKLFFTTAHERGLIDAVPTIRLALERWTSCHETAAEHGLITRPTR
jgi:chorismate dehydratase